jgi:hypothetical protein
MTWQHRMQPVKVGDVVAYNKAFLQNVGAYTGDMPQARGKVTALISSVGKDVTLAEIDWNLPDLPTRVHVKNLIRASDIAFEL